MATVGVGAHLRLWGEPELAATRIEMRVGGLFLNKMDLMGGDALSKGLANFVLPVMGGIA